MNTVLRTLVTIALVVALQAAFIFLIIRESSYAAVLAVPLGPNEMAGKEENQNTSDADILKDLDERRQKIIKYIIIIIFAVLFIAGIYWWTYGKLHHKLPRY